MFWLICIITFVIIAGFISFMVYRNKLIQTAREYLQGEYSREMQYRKVRYNWIVDPAQHHVYFSPAENPEIVFSVKVSHDFSINEPREGFKPDNYYMKYFEWLMADYFRDDVVEIFGNEAEISVLYHNQATVSFKMAHGLHDRLSLEEMEALIDKYWLIIDTGSNETEKTNEFTQIVRESGYTPERIIFQ